ncbi:uncharacterized protein N7459_001570 [Penicillium hispanicum]|uniref:uncharacterized protein n=1 Tax=Penicillium hispanicum TaxID=1080232 RepID=UPI002540D1B0|nr:uncharacterized protein N7459_001570 [Penicillium hispanicum]KAJ5595362.1 hypothetical protein N7459_001570 [Penicillium hispanicum]
MAVALPNPPKHRTSHDHPTANIMASPAPHRIHLDQPVERGTPREWTGQLGRPTRAARNEVHEWRARRTP